MSTLDRPDTSRTVGNDERTELRVRIIAADAQLERIAYYRNEPNSRWPTDISQWFSHSPLAGEDPAQVLRRWWALFEDEVNLVHQVRNRVVHYAAVKDAELLNAAWLIDRLMRTLEPTAAEDKPAGVRARAASTSVSVLGGVIELVTARVLQRPRAAVAIRDRPHRVVDERIRACFHAGATRAEPTVWHV